jgi:hypothetical protein
MSKSRNRILADDTVVLHRDEYERLLEAAENKEDRLALARSGEDESLYRRQARLTCHFSQSGRCPGPGPGRYCSLIRP